MLPLSERWGRETDEMRKLEDTEEEDAEKQSEERERKDDRQRGEEEEGGCLFDSFRSPPQYLFSQDLGRNLQVVKSRCINTRTPTCLDRPIDGVEEEEDSLAILDQPLEAPVVWVVPLVTASSIFNFSN